MKKKLLLSILCLTFIAFAPSAFAINLGTAGNYNAFVLGDFTAQYSDIEGRLAAGGSIDLAGYSVGSKLPASATGNTLVAGGNLDYLGGTVYGNAVVGGNAVTSGLTVTGALTQGVSVPIDFQAEFAYLRGLSTSLSSMTSSDPALLIYNVDSIASLFNITDSLTSIAANTTIVFNISGDTLFMGYYGLQNLDGSNVLFNFYEATSLSFSGIGVEGSILAPLAEIEGNGGNVDGTVIAAAWSGGMELHDYPFENTPGGPVPVPGTLVLLGSGLMAAAGLGRRKK